MSDTGTGGDAPQYALQAVQAVRTATLVNLSLSQMADQKASMMIGAALVVFTLIVGNAGPTGHLPVSLLVLGAFAFVTAFLSMSVVMPSVGVPPGNADDANLMFFGAYTRFDEAEFTERMLVRLRSDDAMFRMMLRDIHQNGQVLRRKKYRLLALAYRTMLTGLVLTLLIFVVEQRATLFGGLT